MMGNKQAWMVVFGTLLIVPSVGGGTLCQTLSTPMREVSATDNAEMNAAKEWLNPWLEGSKKKPQIIQRSRIFVVPVTERSQAIALLRSDSVVPLNDEQASRLLGRRAPTGDEVVDSTISNAQPESKMPGSLSVTENVKYAQTLYGKLKPYLVRAVAANEGRRMFFASWYDDDLSVFNGSFGGFHYVREPLIIYLEKQPQKVWVDAGTGY